MLGMFMARRRMVAELERDGRLHDPALRRAFLRVRRHEFLPRAQRHLAYGVDAVEVLDEQTMTCPGFIAQMTELLEVTPGARVLDVGTGTGYQAAILARMGCSVTGIEVRASMHALALENLARAGLGEVDVRLGDGAPFDAILLACTPREIPAALLDQLAPGGRLVAPEGDHERIQSLVRLRKTPGGIQREEVRAAWFVPMVTPELVPQ